MKKNIIIFGLISGVIITGMMLYGVSACYNNPNFEHNDVLGYTALLVAFSFIFVGIKNYRDKYNGGLITFGKAFKIGFYMSLIASTMYVAAWLVDYYFFVPDFMDHYTKFCINEAREDGVSGAELNQKITEMANLKEMYKNPLFVILITYSEVLPIGLVIALISSFILKKKN